MKYLIVFLVLASTVYAAGTFDAEKADTDFMKQFKTAPTVTLTKKRIVKSMPCINNVTYLEVQHGSRRVPVLYSPKLTSGIPHSFKKNTVITTTVSKKQDYFCIVGLTPLVVYKGSVMRSVE